jgi:hypothetical protein
MLGYTLSSLGIIVHTRDWDDLQVPVTKTTLVLVYLAHLYR